MDTQNTSRQLRYLEEVRMCGRRIAPARLSCSMLHSALIPPWIPMPDCMCSAATPSTPPETCCFIAAWRTSGDGIR